MKELNLSLIKSQVDFIQLQQEVLHGLYIGGYGSGKTFCLSSSGVLDTSHSPNAIVGIYEPTYKDIIKNAMPSIQKIFHENGIEYHTNKEEKTLTPQSDQLGKFWFFSMENPDSLVGYETYTAHVDEIDTLPMEKANRAWDMILARTRQWPKGLPQEYMLYNSVRKRYEPRHKVCAYTTPEGFRFTYKTWGQNRPGTENYNPEYAYLQVCTEDNPTLAESYIEGLRRKYPGPLIDAYLKGKWVNLNSGTVYYAFKRPDEKGLNCGSIETIQKGETLHIGMDFNKNRMCASVFVPRNGGKEWHMVAEIHGLRDTPDMIQYIQDRWQSKGHKIYCYPDASAKRGYTPNASLTDLTLLKDAKFHIVKRYGSNSNPLVVDRVNCLNNAFAKSKLFINCDECPFAADCLEQQGFNKMGQPEKDTGFDDMNDSIGYFGIVRLSIKPQLQLLDFGFANRA